MQVITNSITQCEMSPGRLSGNSSCKIRFPLLGRISLTEEGDVGASATEDDKILAEVGAEDCRERVFGQSAVSVRRWKE